MKPFSITEYEDIKKALDEFTYRPGTAGLLKRRETIFKHGDRIEDEDGIRYIWSKEVWVKVERRESDSFGVTIFSGDITSLKLRKDGISFTIANPGIPKDAPDHIMEVVDRIQNFTKLTAFNEFKIGAYWAHK